MKRTTKLDLAIEAAVREGWVDTGIRAGGIPSYRKGSNARWAIDYAASLRTDLREFKVVTGAKRRYRTQGHKLAVVGRP